MQATLTASEQSFRAAFEAEHLSCDVLKRAFAPVTAGFKLTLFAHLMRSLVPWNPSHDGIYWTSLFEIWHEDQFHSQQSDAIERILNFDRTSFEGHVPCEDRDQWDDLPATIDVFRGVTDRGNSDIDFLKGFSWTVDREIALWFAQRNRFCDTRYLVLSAQVEKRSVAFFLGAESELVIDPSNLRNVRIDREGPLGPV